MVKLASVRSTRLYGPTDSEAACEFVNAIAYLVAAVLLLAGFVLLLPGFNHSAALIVLTVALLLVVMVNLHDLYAQIAGVEFRFGLLASDPQLALVEVGAPIAHTIGAVLFLIALIFLLKTKHFGDGGANELSTMRLLVAGCVFWLIGSLLNASQVYERTGLMLQLCQKIVYIPFVMASTLYLVSSILWLKGYPNFLVLKRVHYAAPALSIVASILLLIGSIANISRVGYLRRLAAQEGSPRVDNLRGGTRERVEMERGYEHTRPLLHEHHGRLPTHGTTTRGEGGEESLTYRDALAR